MSDASTRDNIIAAAKGETAPGALSLAANTHEGSETEWWKPTVQLRYGKDGTLQQAWIDNRGRIEWRPIPAELV